MNDSSTIINSEIAPSSKIYKGCLIRNSFIGEDCLCADDVVVDRSRLADHVEVGRRSYVQDSSFGFGSYIGPNSLVKFTDIAKFTSIAWNISIGGSNHDYGCPSMYTSYWWKKVFGVKIPDHNEGLTGTIGNGVWIGSGVNIMRGIHIGDGAVIGAGSIVTKDVPPCAIVCNQGGAAKVLKYRFSESLVADFLESEWWNWPKELIVQHSDLLSIKMTNESVKRMIEIKRSL